MNHYLNEIADIIENELTRDELVYQLRRAALTREENLVIATKDSNVLIVTENYLKQFVDISEEILKCYSIIGK